MKSLRNSVQLIGRLGNDPELKNLEGGKMLTKFSIATSDSYKNSEGERVQDTQWHNVTAWGKTAEIASKYLKKGSEVAVEGKLVHRSYENTAGERKYVTEITLNELVMMGSKKD